MKNALQPGANHNRINTAFPSKTPTTSNVKLLSTDLDNSAAGTEAKVDVCPGKFSPSFGYHLAFVTVQITVFTALSGQITVHYYDSHNAKQPIMIFKEHQKTTS